MTMSNNVFFNKLEFLITFIWISDTKVLSSTGKFI